MASRGPLSPEAVLVEISAQHRADVGREPGGGIGGDGGHRQTHVEPKILL